MFAVGHAAGRFVAAHANAPDRGVIPVFLLVHSDPHKGHARSIRGDLRIADPVELKNIFLCDGTFLRLGKSGHRRGQQQRDRKKTGGTGHESSLEETYLYTTAKKPCPLTRDLPGLLLALL